MKVLRERTKMLCTKSQYGAATWWELLQLKIFIFFWKECSEFSQRNTKFTSLCERAELNALSEKEKAEMKKKLEEEF
ncbi:MAG: hypothetical protein ACFB0A_03965 [Croceivirga sp.]